MREPVRIPMWLVTPIAAIVVLFALLRPHAAATQAQPLALALTATPALALSSHTVAAPSATAVPSSPTPQPPTVTPVPPTATTEPPTATPQPPTATPAPPTATSIPPTATPVPPTATPKPKPGTVLYQANWANGPDGWTQSDGWKNVSDLFVSDGTNGDDTQWVRAPLAIPVSDYAVEAQIQLVTQSACAAFGIVVRGSGDGVYFGGVRSEGGSPDTGAIAPLGGDIWGNAIATGGFSPRNSWHTYTMIAKGNQLALDIDGTQVANGVDNRYVLGGNVGLIAVACQVDVRSFKIVTK